MAVVFKKPTPPNHDPLDVLEELGLLIRRYKGQIETLLASATKQAEINGAVRTLGGLLKQYADISYDLGHPKKMTTKIPPKYEEPIYSPIREQILYNIELDKKITETERKFFEIMDSVPEEQWEKARSVGPTEAEKKFFETMNSLEAEKNGLSH